MEMIIYFVSMLTVGAATDANVYVYNGYEFYGPAGTLVFRPVPSACFIFGYQSGDLLSMQIYLRNESLNVTTNVYLTYPSGVNMHKETLKMYLTNKQEKYYMIRRHLNYSEIAIGLELSSTAGLCTRKQIVKGKAVTGLPDETNATSYNNICLKNQYCVIEVDLLNNVSEESIVQPVPFQNAGIVYVITSVMVMCVTILVIYIGVEKYCHRNSRPVETIELNTYATANEVVYADLGFVHADSQPPRRDEESPYAEIIGVLNPS